MTGVEDDAVQRYIDAIAPEHRPMFDRVQGLILEVEPDAEIVLSYNMPSYQVHGRRLHVGAWKHGLSLYGWDQERNAAFVERHPHLVSSAGTIRLRASDLADLSDDELRAFVHAALDG
jgi:uncharacterized protein YdhG (YjbR/CyaY superfamily)